METEIEMQALSGSVFYVIDVTSSEINVPTRALLAAETKDVFYQPQN